MVGTGVAERNLCTCARIEWLRMPEIIQIPKEEKGLKHMKTKDLVLCAMFVALIAVGAFIKIPVPVVPFTLQFLFTMLAGLLLGPVNGALAVVVYIVLGLVVSASVKVAGDTFNQAILNYVRKNHGLFIGEDMAEKIKIQIGTAIEESNPRSRT